MRQKFDQVEITSSLRKGIFVRKELGSGIGFAKMSNLNFSVHFSAPTQRSSDNNLFLPFRINESSEAHCNDASLVFFYLVLSPFSLVFEKVKYFNLLQNYSCEIDVMNMDFLKPV